MGGCFVDLMCRPGDNAKLHGQVLSADGETERFEGDANLSRHSQGLGQDGQFDLSIEAEGEQKLTRDLNSKIVEVNGLSFLEATMW